MMHNDVEVYVDNMIIKSKSGGLYSLLGNFSKDYDSPTCT